MKGNRPIQQPRVRPYKRVVSRHSLLVIGTILIIGTLIGSFLPGPTKARLGIHPYAPTDNHVQMGHRLCHFAAFGSIALVYSLLASGIRGEVKVGLSVFALGCLIESTQNLIGLSDVFEWWDVRDNLYAVAGVFVFVQIANRICSRATESENKF